MSGFSEYAIYDFVAASNFQAVLDAHLYNAIRLLDPNISNAKQIKANAKAVLNEEKAISSIRNKAYKMVKEGLLAKGDKMSMFQVLRKGAWFSDKVWS